MESKHELETVKWGVIPVYNYQGVLVEKIIGGYKVLNQTCIKPIEVDEVLKNACKSIEGSIVVKASGGSISSQSSLGGISVSENENKG